MPLVFAGLLAGCGGSDPEPSSELDPGGTTVIVPPSLRDAERTRFMAYVTGYSYWDNTPPGTAEIALPHVHRRAGGTGTYDDPITLAVGHSLATGRSVPDFRKGTRFYFMRLRKYAIVEDVCGDGPTPENGPCHSGRQGKPWLDIWVDGSDVTAQLADMCMYRITGFQSVIIGPERGFPVDVGSIVGSGCKVY